MTPDQIVEAQRMASEWMQAHEPPVAAPPINGIGESAVPMVRDGGTFKVPVTINGQLRLEFIVDSGASDVSIPVDVVMTLLRTGTITDADFLDKQTYQLADGSTIPSQRFVIHTLKIGDNTLENVVGSIAPAAGSLLLGQSFLGRFKAWSIDNQRRALILIDNPLEQPTLPSPRPLEISGSSSPPRPPIPAADEAHAASYGVPSASATETIEMKKKRCLPFGETAAAYNECLAKDLSKPQGGPGEQAAAPRSDEVGANAPFSTVPPPPAMPKARPRPVDPTQGGVY
jgi:clan AA aspartic protease (TIGR02281 family)